MQFPGNALAANDFNGDFRGYNVVASSASLSCLDIENKGNPFRFYGLTVKGCQNNGTGIGINLVSTAGAEFFGANAFGNDIDLSVSGMTHLDEAYLVFDGLHLDNSTNENMYLDQQNETVICTSNCRPVGGAAATAECERNGVGDKFRHGGCALGEWPEAARSMR